MLPLSHAKLFCLCGGLWWIFLDVNAGWFNVCFSLLSVFFLSARFINARRRIVQPMIDQSNRAGKKKKENNPANVQYSTASPTFLSSAQGHPFQQILYWHAHHAWSPDFCKGVPYIYFYSLLFLSLPSSPFPFSQWDVFSSGAGHLLIDSNWRFPSLSGERGILALSLWITNWTQEECQKC